MNNSYTNEYQAIQGGVTRYVDIVLRMKSIKIHRHYDNLPGCSRHCRYGGIFENNDHINEDDKKYIKDVEKKLFAKQMHLPHLAKNIECHRSIIRKICHHNPKYDFTSNDKLVNAIATHLVFN